MTDETANVKMSKTSRFERFERSLQTGTVLHLTAAAVGLSTRISHCDIYQIVRSPSSICPLRCR